MLAFACAVQYQKQCTANVSIACASSSLVYRTGSSDIKPKDPVAQLVESLYQKEPMLSSNALQMRVHPKLSLPNQPLQFGVYACIDIPKGTAVCWYGGVAMHKSDIDPSLGVSHVRSMGGDYVLNGNVFASKLNRDPEGPQSPRTPHPPGFMCNTSGTRAGNNVRIRKRRLLDLIDVPFLEATRDISKGEEILCFYGNTHSKSHSHAFVKL
jgi:hypothetical protein